MLTFQLADVIISLLADDCLSADGLTAENAEFIAEGAEFRSE
jgi:hypothetical protein